MSDFDFSILKNAIGTVGKSGTWVTEADACPQCAAMNGKEVHRDVQPPLHPNCKCRIE